MAQDDRTKIDRFNISADELTARMLRKHKEQTEPAQRAAELLDAALELVVKKLGVIPELGNIPEQQEALGIIITEETREDYAKINGFFVFVQKSDDIVPYAWVGAARLNSQGECFVDIHYFMDNRLEETGGIKLIH